MSVIAIGDIHGQSEALRDLLVQILPELRQEDTLVFLGDYIDRGPHSRECVDQIIRLKAESPCPVITLLGNHEQWMLRSLNDPTRHSWLIGMDALETIKNYSEEAASQIAKALDEYGARLFTMRIALPYHLFLHAMPREHLEFFLHLETYYREDGIICVHGGVDLEGIVDPVDVNTCVWGPSGFPEEYSGEDAVVYGHRHNAVVNDDGSIQPCIGSNKTYGIDTISHGVLTALRLPDGKIFQSAKHATG
jgi:serine/threonine protein phosphatase 1